MPRSSKNNEYLSNGISISPSTPAVGDKVKVVYDGLLSKSGASHIYAHVGYGCKWNNQSFFKMERSNMGFEATIPISGTSDASSDTMNLCFKDCANNWDNNSGKNYSFDISQ